PTRGAVGAGPVVPRRTGPRRYRPSQPSPVNASRTLGEEDGLTLLLRRRVRHPLRRAVGLATLSLLVAALIAWTPAMTAGWNPGPAEGTRWQPPTGGRVSTDARP